ncbi:hypothetical protein Drose_26350 [Dactylosporangium roseum]|uniref:Uncharacterized protein n=1 Tax=Dactylosporangium roseum TaxID=47989 RepID=A0ABY5YY82_9ACTN|nr:hypothetical protein [Dactylosporangium roseum]UWZ34716.1 hypothetical protein Drose_26350 [Dactylosporangium roseum]
MSTYQPPAGPNPGFGEPWPAGAPNGFEARGGFGPPARSGPPSSPAAPGGFGPPPMAPPAKPKRQGPVTILAVLLIGLTLLCCGVPSAGIGAALGGGLTQPDGPSEPPNMPAEFPNTNQRYLPGTTINDVAEQWMKKDNGWVCTPPEQADYRLSEAKNRLECVPTDKDLKYDVDVAIEYDGDNQLTQVEASCNFKPGAEMCRSLFATMADVLYLNRSENRKPAEEWASKNVDTDNTTVIGGIRLTVSLSPHQITAIPYS